MSKSKQWYDAPITKEEIKRAGDSLISEFGETTFTMTALLDRAEELRWRDALKAWLTGVAAWGTEARAQVRSYVVHAKQAGMVFD